VYREQPRLILINTADLPSESGWESLRRIRSVSDIPILALVAQGNEGERVRALALGADDCLTMPIQPPELIARLDALIRRAPPASPPSFYASEDLVVDFRTREVLVQGQSVRLTPTEFRLLECFLQTPGQVVSKEQLAEALWGKASSPHIKAVKVYVQRLRTKLEPQPARPTYIVNHRGRGYRLTTR